MSPEACDTHRLSGRAGFTFIELVIVIAIVAIMALAALPFIGRFQQSQTLQSLSEDIAHALSRAQVRAMTGDGAMRWGLRILSGSYVLYAGTSYAAHVAAHDEIHTVALPAVFAGQREYTFDGVNGKPTRSGSLILTDSSGNSATITVNAQGGIFLSGQ